MSVANVENAHHSTRLLSQTTLRNILGTKNLHEILSDREGISGAMQVERHPVQWFNVKTFMLIQAALDEATEPWGIKVERVEMLVIFWIALLKFKFLLEHSKDARLPIQLQRAMAAEAEAAREARAKVWSYEAGRF